MKDVVVVTSGKGGVGKSTLSSMIGLSLSQKYQVLLIDADLGLKNLDLIFNVKSTNYDISDVVKGRCEIDQATIKIKDNLSLLNLCLSSDVRSFPSYLLETIIDELKNDYDYIIVDSPAGIEQGFFNTLSVCTKAIIVLNDEITSFEDGRKIQRLCKINNVKNIIYVMNRFDKKYSVRDYVKTKFSYYFNTHDLIFINNVIGNFYKKYRIISRSKEFNELINQIRKGNTILLV